MAYKNIEKRREYHRNRYRKLSNSVVKNSPITPEIVIHDTIVHDSYVEMPLYDFKHEIVGYTKIDKNIYKSKFIGVKLNKSNHGYARFGNDFVHYYIKGKPRDRWTFIDHINRDRLDNRACNIRFVTPTENCRNSKTFGGGYGIGGIRGITFVKGRKSPWKVSIFEERYKGKSRVKYFGTLEEAKGYREKFPL